MRLLHFRMRDLSILAAAGLAVACGGGGGSGGSGASAGTFIDSAVAGLRYVGDNFSGRTSASGRYDFEEGDEVCFFLDGLALGCLTAMGDGIVTPMDIFDADSDDPAVQNMVRFLLALDADGDASNGIDVGDIDTGDSTTPLDFDQSMVAFEADPDVLDFIDTYGFDGDLADMTDAANHFDQSLEDSNYFEQDIVGRWLYTRRVAGSTAESSFFEIDLADVESMNLDVDEDGDVEFLKSVLGQSCSHDGEFDDEELNIVAGSIDCGQQTQFEPLAAEDSFRMDRMVSGTQYSIDDLSTPASWLISSMIVGGATFETFDAQGIMDTNATMSAGGTFRFELMVEIDEQMENCVFEGQMNVAKDFGSGDVDCPSEDDAFEMTAVD